MNRPKRTLWLVALVPLAAAPLAGCRGPDAEEAAANGDTTSGSPASDVSATTDLTHSSAGGGPTRPALPNLFSIMAGLEGDMAKLSRGLWAENFDTVAAAAGAVANHPPIPPEEGQKIARALGDDMRRFQELDTEVHDLSERIRMLAAQGDLRGILSTETQLRDGCVTCHSQFRMRLRMHFADAEPPTP